MIIKRIFSFYLFLLFFIPSYSFPQNAASISQDLILLRPTGEIINNFREMVIIPDTSLIYRKTRKIIDDSFIKEMVKLYGLAQIYLENLDGEFNSEPLYLAVTKNEGGFAKKGFVLFKDGKHLEKPEAHYVDIVESRITSNVDRLMSFTQLYPHELGHVLYHMLSDNSDSGRTSPNINMHYFSLQTDYSTAFDEGFAEQFENLSRFNEQNKKIKEGIFRDIKQIEKYTARNINSFKKDLIWPLRIGFYKITMPVWYQKYENLKRYKHSLDNSAAYKNSTIELPDEEDMITFRNSGLEPDTNKRKNSVQLMSTEGFICSFFTHLNQSSLPGNYRAPAFYANFLSYPLKNNFNPADTFTPLQNQIIKYFYILNKYVKVNHSDRAQLIDFIDGYIKEFPDEADNVLNIYKGLTGMSYRNSLPPRLWMLAKNHSHRILVMDAVGNSAIPFYTFDLNAAEPEDLITIKGIDRQQAKSIIDYRNKNGYFQDYTDVNNIPGISPAAAEILIASKFDQLYFNKNKSFNFSLNKIINGSLYYLGKNALFYFLIFSFIIYPVLIRNSGLNKLKVGLTYLSYLLIWLVFLLAGLFSMLLNGSPSIFFLIILLLTILILYLIFGKEKSRFYRHLIIIFLMGTIMFYSII
ncbi:MAG TPA: helix-hairpin-helix domain-containing protein [Ignavibacteriaceae bacterium]|nr:helix-hairpin-helix domain-containing protein [Ignavibacteriaceae bacterium]